MNAPDYLYLVYSEQLKVDSEPDGTVFADDLPEAKTEASERNMMRMHGVSDWKVAAYVDTNRRP